MKKKIQLKIQMMVISPNYADYSYIRDLEASNNQQQFDYDMYIKTIIEFLTT